MYLFAFRPFRHAISNVIAIITEIFLLAALVISVGFQDRIGDKNIYCMIFFQYNFP